MKKKGVITSRKGIANVFGEFHKQIHDDNEQEETEQEMGENENESSIDVRSSDTNEVMKNPRDYDRLRQMSCKLQSTNSKKGKSQTATESELKTSKHATMRREKG